MIGIEKYIAPVSLKDLLDLLGSNNGNYKILAGGTDVIPGIRSGAGRFKNVKVIVDINKIGDLKSIIEDKEYISLGSGVTLDELSNNRIVEKNFPVLHTASQRIGSKQIRNVATLGGNIVNNAPCADTVPALLVYDAEMRILSQEGERRLPLKDFLIDSYKVDLGNKEVVAQIILPKLRRSYQSKYLKLGRRRGVSISRLSLAVLMNSENFTIRDLRISAGAILSKGTRFEEIEKSFTGYKLNEKNIRKISRGTTLTILNNNKLRWSASYKIPVLQNMVYQLLAEIRDDIKTKN